jgi:hypothetical protein
MTEPTSTNHEWRFDDLRALYINCTSSGPRSAATPRA